MKKTAKTKEANLTTKAARSISDGEWYTSNQIAEKLDIDNNKAKQVIQRIERSGYYEKEIDRSVCPMKIRLLAINGVKIKSTYWKRFRLVVFGEQIA